MRNSLTVKLAFFCITGGEKALLLDGGSVNLNVSGNFDDISLPSFQF